MDESDVAYRIWGSYISHEGGSKSDHLHFTTKEAAMAEVIHAYNTSLPAAPPISKADFDRANDYVWKADVPGPATPIVLHTPVYEEAVADD